MAYQPKSYRKFVATAATATLVAGAIAPIASAASFTDVSAKYKEAVDFVVSKGANGLTSTTFGVGSDIKRVDAAVLLVNVLGLDIEKAPASGFTDVPARAAKHVNALKAAGITNGKSATKFDAESKITRGELALWIQKGFELKGEGNVTFTDVSDRYKEAVSALVANEITNGISATQFGTDKTAKRGDYAIFLQKAAAPVSPVSIASVSAINAKTIEVKFNKAVDTDKAQLELLRGTFKQNFTATWSEDKKSVQLAGATNFQAADYTVNITGLGKDVLTGTVKIEAQKVASIQILDEVAVVDKAVDANGVLPALTTATVGYVVKDQYGTDITKTTTLTTNDAANITAANGVVKLSSGLVVGKKVNDLVPVVLIDQATGTSAAKTVKLSAESTVSSIEVAGIYNAKGEAVALTDKSKANEAFIVLNLKDQYGKEITDAAKATGLVITNTNPTNLTIASSATKVKIGDKDKLVIALSAILKAGDTDVLLISTTNGQSAKYTVKVSETSTTDAISVSQPEIAVAGESTLIPLTVTDKEGNVITDKKLLADANKGIKVGNTTVSESELEVKDGQVYYKKSLSAGTQALVFQTSTYKVATITINVKAAAVPTVVRGVKNPLVISTAQNPVTITAKDHLIIEDQYGRVMKDSTAPVTVSLVGTSDVVSLTGNVVSPAKKGTATLQVALATQNGTIDSAVEVKVQVTDGTEYNGYEIAEIGKTKVATAKAIKVNGLLNGGKVALESGEYTATISGGKLASPQAVTGGSFTLADGALNTDSSSNKVDTEFTLTVTINATGKVLEQKFVVSAQAEKVQDFFFTSTAVNGDYNSAKAITEATLAAGSTVADLKTGETPVAVNVATVDQYGNKAVTAIVAETVTIVPEKVADVTISNNGTPAASVTLKNGVTESNVTLNIKIGNTTKELKVKVVTP
ncbi:S-layer homology domain-containing protein [Peribacillus sp. NPDC096379]|uniref:S-layer homology domain-containing protein n=1 Tax=Peribacillus sp. NPDC096379 TaxID=3364393 RepID=UPI003821D325